MRRVVVAEDRQRAQHGDARRIARHEDHRLLAVARRVRGVGPAHHDEQRAARVGRAGCPPLAAVDHVVGAVAHDRGPDVRRVARGHCRLGHGEAGADFAGEQRFEPAALLFGRAVALEHFHVAGVGCRAIEHLRRPDDAAHDLAQRRIFEVREAGAARGIRQKKVPEPRGARLRLELVDDAGRAPAVALGDLVEEHLLVRVDVFVHERREAREQSLRARVVLEVHGHSPGRMTSFPETRRSINARSASPPRASG